MEKVDLKGMSNGELKLLIQRKEFEFEAKKGEIREKCNELCDIESEYNAALTELNMRKNLYV